MHKFIQTRTEYAKREKQSLAVYGQASMDSRGRKYPEKEHDFRTVYQRDRDRVIHSASFRRLEAKTQVFLDSGSDYYRTRLTHTIEVAQIARTMARILSVNEDLAEAVSLAHDLGHPPYGHCGEMVLNELMAEYGGFEHNCQSLRIVEYLEHPYPDFRGLNLSYETRECLARHETRYDHPEIHVEFGEGQALIEGQIADLADTIAYNSHDLDDALAAGLLAESDLEEVSLYALLKEKISRQFPHAHRFARQLRTSKSLIELLTMDAVEEAALRLGRFNPQSPEQVRRLPEKIVALSTERQRQLDELQQFLYNNVYQHPRVSRARRLASEQLQYLFNRYKSEPSLLPVRYQERLNTQPLTRVICDYLAGMTDRFCQGLYFQLQE